MKAELNINDDELISLIKKGIDNKFNELNINELIQSKINSKLDVMLSKNNLSKEKIENFAKDRISRIITTDSLKDVTNSVTGSDVLANLESKILLMIKNSIEFKKLVISVLKNSL